MSDIAGECADALIALINSRPSSPRRDEIMDALRPLLDKAVRSAIDEHQINQSGVTTYVWGDPNIATTSAVSIVFNRATGTYHTAPCDTAVSITPTT